MAFTAQKLCASLVAVPVRLSTSTSRQSFIRFLSSTSSDDSSMEALSKLSVKDLRRKIVKAGYSYKDCYEKTDLVKRAFDSLKQVKDYEENRNESGNKKVTESIQRWINGMVIGLDLCPFAKAHRQNIDIVIVNQSSRLEKAFVDEDYIAQIDQHIENMTFNDELSVKSILLVITDPLYVPMSAWTSFVHRLTSEPRPGRDVNLDPIPNVIRLDFFHPTIVKAGLHEKAPNNFLSRAPFPIVQLLKRVDVDNAVHQYLEHYPDAKIITEANENQKIAQLTEKNNQTLEQVGYHKLQTLLDGLDNRFKEGKELADFQRMFRMMRENIASEMLLKKEVPYHRIKLAQLANELDQHGDAGEIIYNNRRKKSSYDHLPVVAKLLKDMEVLLTPINDERKKEREAFGAGHSVF